MQTDEKHNDLLTSAHNSVYEDTPQGSVLFGTDTQVGVPQQNAPIVPTPVAEGTEVQPELPNPLAQPAMEGPLATEELPPPQSGHPPSHPPEVSGGRGVIRNAFIILLLLLLGIAVGIGLRGFILRPQFDQESTLPTVTPSLSAPSPTPLSGFDRPQPATFSGSWRSYSVINGTTNVPIEGFTFELPEEVGSPLCDGGNCASQGTYLPGGTRFTVAARGNGQVLPDFQGSGISDVSGRNFTSSEATVAGTSAVTFNGDFSGTTVGGYQFTRMRGVMIPLTKDLSIEVNHFSPRGITVNFEEDERIFEEILSRILISIPLTK